MGGMALPMPVQEPLTLHGIQVVGRRMHVRKEQITHSESQERMHSACLLVQPVLKHQKLISVLLPLDRSEHLEVMRDHEDIRAGSILDRSSRDL